jgi:thymidine kinase
MTIVLNNPTFTVFAGSMFSSKTSKLLSTLERYKYQRKRSAVFKPAVDDRYSSGEIVTHSGWSTPAHIVKTGADILEVLAQLDDEPNVVAVDEAFMIPHIAETLIWLFQNGIDIIVSTLDISSSGKSFNEVEKMLAWATHVEKCAAVCTICARDAYYTHKKLIDNIENEICVGGAELYEPRCFSHHAYVDKREKIHAE